jgi:hypothetical protein
VTDEFGAVLAEGVEFGVGEEAAVGEDGVKGFDGVAFALDIAVAVWVGEGFGGNAEDAVVEDVKDVEAREGAAGVARAGVVDGREGAAAEVEGFESKIVVRHCRELRVERMMDDGGWAEIEPQRHGDTERGTTKLASQAHHEMDAPSFETASRKVVTKYTKRGEALSRKGAQRARIAWNANP